MTKISKHISYREATRSNTAKRYGIDNTPGIIELRNMKRVANLIFEPVRIHFGVPIFVSSFYRSWKLNAKVGGSKTSDHPEGKAIDIDDVLGGVSNADIFYYIKDNLDFDQLIWEYGNDGNPAWVHVSYDSAIKNRNQVLRTKVTKNIWGYRKVSYVPFIDFRPLI